MKKLLALLPLLFLACEQHVPNPKVRDLEFEHPHVLVDSLTGAYVTPEKEPLDSFYIELNVIQEDSYLLDINGTQFNRHWSIGTHLVGIGWDEFVVGYEIIVKTGNPQFADEMQHLSIPVIRPIAFEDPFIPYAWHLQVPDQTFQQEWGIDPQSHINIAPVWNTNRGRGVKVAVLDVDIQATHEDLLANVISTYNAKTNSSTITASGYNSFHGTSVAGMIGAVGNNDLGIVGIAPEVELILIDVPSGSDAEAIRAFNYAKDQGAKVINCSWGSHNVSELLSEAIKEIYDAGITVVFAAGNRAYDLDYPTLNDESELPWVIGVGSSDEENDFWDGSDYGSELDLIAPGGSRNPGVAVLGGMGDEHSHILNENYRYNHGCSFAAPAVAAVAAIMYEVNPELTPDDVREILIQTTDKVGGESADYSNGFDKRRFHGKLNAYRAVQKAREW